MSDFVLHTNNPIDEDPDEVVKRFESLPPNVTPLMAASGLLIKPKYIIEKPKVTRKRG